MLEDKLQPLLEQLRTPGLESQQLYDITHAWFTEHTENLAEDIADLAYFCSLPTLERRLVTHGVMGNWFLAKMEQFTPENSTQADMYRQIRELVVESRFNNDHLKWHYTKKEEFATKIDQVNSLMITNPEDGLVLHNLLKSIALEIATVDKSTLPKREYTTDFGHGFTGPAGHFSFITFFFETINERSIPINFDVNIMVVDDERPKEWYQRMITVGFKEVAGQQGYFFDAESALEALRLHHYDVILSDINLGDGKMDGIEFARQAHAIQKSKGVVPRISVFSYERDLLKRAEKELRKHIDTEEDILMHQVEYDNDKSTFQAVRFRTTVEYSLRRFAKQ